MRRLLFKLLVLVLILFSIDALYLRYSSGIIEYTMGPSTLKQIDRSFENSLSREYDLLILGNSKFYRGLNPDCFDIAAFNFAHDNDGYNQMYYRLKYLLENRVKISYLVLSVDYAPFSNISDTRNRYFKDYFDMGYFDDYSEPYSGIHEKYSFSNDFNNYMALRFNMTFPKFLESCIRILLKKVPEQPPILKENGQYLKAGRPTPDLFVVRNYANIELQEKYFLALLGLSKTNHIKVLLVMPPYLKEDLLQFPEGQVSYYTDYFNKLEDNLEIIYFDFSRDEDFSSEHFSGLAHLNEQAADLFSIKLNDSINCILEKEKHNSGINGIQPTRKNEPGFI